MDFKYAATLLPELKTNCDLKQYLRVSKNIPYKI